MRDVRLVLFALLAGLCDVPALAKEPDSPAVVRPSPGGPRHSEITPEDVLKSRSDDEFWIWRHSVTVRADGSGVIEAEVVPIRSSPFVDGLGRKAIRLGRVFFKTIDDGTGDKMVLARERDEGAGCSLAVHLVDPVGEGEKWLPRDDRPLVGRTERVLFVCRGKLSSTLPEPFVRRTDGLVAALPIDRPVWVSGRIVPDSTSFLIAKTERFSFKEFSDEDGGAALVKMSRKGEIECATGRVTKGVNFDGRQSRDPAVFDRSKYAKITWFTEEGTTSPFPPRRLRRRPVFQRGWTISLEQWPDGSKMYLSARDRLVIRMDKVVVGELTPWALAADEPFADEFGDARGLMVQAVAVARGMYGIGCFEPDPPWTVRLVSPHNAIYATAFAEMSIPAGLMPADDK
jgi:hypothetical protein